MTTVETPHTPAPARTGHRRPEGDLRINEWGPGDKWDRQPNETAGAYQSFLAYLHQDRTPRSIRAAGADRRGARSRDLPSRFRWRERAAAYDEHMERVRVETERRERQEMVERHVAFSMQAQDSFAKALARVSEDDAYELILKRPADAWRLLEGAARLERESRGVGPQERAEAAQGTPGVQLARAMLMNPEAHAKWLDALDLVSEAVVAESRRPVIDATTREPLGEASE